jgi:GPH family glycoside/pentoside/hexuronide:cation symporter
MDGMMTVVTYGLGTLLGFLIPDFFRPKAGESPSFLPLQISMVVVGVISLAAILPATFRVKERLEFTRVDEPLRIKDALRYSLTSRSFLILLIQSFAATLMQSLVMGALYYLADYVLHMNTVILLIWVFVPLMAAVPVTAWLRARVGVVGAQQVMLAIAGVGLTLVTVAPVSLVPVCVALGGFGIGGVETLSTVLFAQVADEDELRTGVRREGAFFGVNALITKPAQSIAIALSPLILEATRFVTREANGGQVFLNQPASAIFGIRAITGLVPGVAMLLGALILQVYPLRGQYLEQVQGKVLDLHAAKQAALQEREQPLGQSAHPADGAPVRAD